MKHRPLRGTVLLVTAMFSVSFMGVFSRRLDCNDIAVQFLRSFFAVAAFLVIYLVRDGASFLKPPRFKTELPVFIIYAVSILFSSFFFLMAFRYTTFANTIILHYLTPFIVLFAETVLFKKRVRPFRYLAAVIGLAGIGIGVYDNISFAVTMDNLMGNGAAVLSAFGFSAIILVTRHTRQKGLPINRTLFWSWFFVLLFVLPVFITRGRLPLTGSNMLYGFLTGTLCTVAVYILMNLGMQYVDAGQAAVINFSEVIFTIIAGAVFFGERISPSVIAGCAVLLACVAFISLEKGDPVTAVP